METLQSPQPTQHTVCSPLHFPTTIHPFLHLRCLHHQLILYLADEVAYSSAVAPNTLPASLCGHLKSSVASICETPQISCISTSHEGIYLGARKQAYLCMKC